MTNPSSARFDPLPYKQPLRILMQKHIPWCVRPQNWSAAIGLERHVYLSLHFPMQVFEVFMRSSSMVVQSPPFQALPVSAHARGGRPNVLSVSEHLYTQLSR